MAVAVHDDEVETAGIEGVVGTERIACGEKLLLGQTDHVVIADHPVPLPSPEPVKNLPHAQQIPELHLRILVRVDHVSHTDDKIQFTPLEHLDTGPEFPHRLLTIPIRIHHFRIVRICKHAKPNFPAQYLLSTDVIGHQRAVNSASISASRRLVAVQAAQGKPGVEAVVAVVVLQHAL